MDQWANNNGTNQKWVATAAGSNWIFTNVASGLALDVAGFATGAAAVDQAQSTHDTNQVWSVTSTGAGNYTIGNQNSGLVVDISGASTVNGGQALQYANNGGNNQRWTFTSLN